MVLRRIVTACAFALLLVLAACSGKPKLDRDSPETIVLWHYYIGEQKKALDALVEEFNLTAGAEEGIRLAAVSKADVQELNRQIIATANGEPGADEPPNLFTAYGDVAHHLAQRDRLVDLSRYIDAKTLEEYVPGFLDEGYLYGDKRLFILPTAKSTEVLIVNRTYFDRFCEEAAGASYPPVSIGDFGSWEGILRASEIYHEWAAAAGEEDRSALFGLDSVANFLFAGHKQLGHDLIRLRDGKGVVDFSGDVLERVWYTYYTPMLQGHFAAFGRFRSDDFKTGDVVSYLGSVSSAAYLPREIVEEDGSVTPIELAVLPMPVFEGGQPTAIQQGAGMSVLASTAEKEYASAVFALWFTENDRNIDFATRSAYMPVRTGAIRALMDAYRSKPPAAAVDLALSTAISQVDSGYLMYVPPAIDASYNVRSILEDQLKNAVERSREAVSAEVAAGADYRRAIEQYTAREQFLNYVDDCAAALAACGVEVIR